MANVDDLLTKMMEARMGVNPYISLGANVGGNLISAVVAEQARRRAQDRLSSLTRPQLPRFRENPFLSQRIAQQQQLADQPMMGYQRAADAASARQMERGRQIAAGLGGGAGLAYMQGLSANAADQERNAVLQDMAMQRQNRSDLDQLINMRNQEMQQQRAMQGMEYQLGFQDYVRQREGLEADIAQQRANIGAAIGATVADIPKYVQDFRMYNALKKSSEPTGTTKTTGTTGATSNPILQVPDLTIAPKTFTQRMTERLGPKLNLPAFSIDPRSRAYSMAMGVSPFPTSTIELGPRFRFYENKPPENLNTDPETFLEMNNRLFGSRRTQPIGIDEGYPNYIGLQRGAVRGVTRPQDEFITLPTLPQRRINPISSTDTLPYAPVVDVQQLEPNPSAELALELEDFYKPNLKSRLGIKNWKDITNAQLFSDRDKQPIKVVLKNRRPGLFNDDVKTVKKGQFGFDEAVEYAKLFMQQYPTSKK